MSSHYIYIACTTPGCASYEPLYTGDLYTEQFDDSGPDSWEGETINVRCKKCQADESTPEIFPGTREALDALTIRPNGVTS